MIPSGAIGKQSQDSGIHVLWRHRPGISATRIRIIYGKRKKEEILELIWNKIPYLNALSSSSVLVNCLGFKET